MKGYAKIIRDTPKLKTRRPNERDALRQAIHVWIAEDVGVAAKMTITPDMVEKLLGRIDDYSE